MLVTYVLRYHYYLDECWQKCAQNLAETLNFTGRRAISKSITGFISGSRYAVEC